MTKNVITQVLYKGRLHEWWCRKKERWWWGGGGGGATRGGHELHSYSRESVVITYWTIELIALLFHFIQTICEPPELVCGLR